MKTTNKYSAIRSGGYDSQLERAYAERLSLYVKAGKIKSFVPHPAAVQLTPRIKWKIDFLVFDKVGKGFRLEVKGVKTREYSLKLRMWKDLRPDQPLLVIAGKKRHGEYGFWPIESIAMGDIDFPDKK